MVCKGDEMIICSKPTLSTHAGRLRILYSSGGYFRLVEDGTGQLNTLWMFELGFRAWLAINKKEI